MLFVLFALNPPAVVRSFPIIIIIIARVIFNERLKNDTYVDFNVNRFYGIQLWRYRWTDGTTKPNVKCEKFVPSVFITDGK